MKQKGQMRVTLHYTVESHPVRNVNSTFYERCVCEYLDLIHNGKRSTVQLRDKVSPAGIF